MGGSGSGTWYRLGSKDTVDGVKSLDINWLNRKGFLRAGRVFTLSWTYRGEPSGWIRARSDPDQVTLTYRCRYGGGDWKAVEEPVRLTWTRCNYGGRRPWFICPRVGCGRRVGKLYAGGKYFLCRHCYDLAYESQREDISLRLLRKAQNIKTRLGGDPSSLAPFPDKPKGMHWKTYWRLYRGHQEADTLSWVALAERVRLRT